MSSTWQLLTKILPIDVVTIVDEMLHHHPAHHFYRPRDSCICCGIYTKPTGIISQFLHCDVQLHFSVLMRQIIYTYSSLETKSVAHSDIRSALRVIYAQITAEYYTYIDKMQSGWMLCLNGVDSHIAVACNSSCLQQMKQKTQLIYTKNTTGVWVPFTKFYTSTTLSYCVPQYICRDVVSTMTHKSRVAILISEVRLRHRLMLKHARNLARIHRNAIIQSAPWQTACMLCHQISRKANDIRDTIQRILIYTKNERTLSGLFYKHDSILSFVDRCYWES